ncbi:J domain-containing protein [Rhizobium sp.]
MDKARPRRYTVAVNDPYDILGLARDADDAAIRTAFRAFAKQSHPDSGGDAEAFVLGQKAQDLLLDPLRRKVFDATGYDPELADARDIQGLMLIEKLVNDIVLDEREPGTFDPLEKMRATLNGDIRKARFHMREMEGHGARVNRHIARLGRGPGSDVLGYMLRARIDAIGKAVQESAKQIEASERALEMLGAYSYELDELPLAAAPAKN